MSRRFRPVSHPALIEVAPLSHPSSITPFDAIIVPASRPTMRRVVTLAANLSIPLVAFCSRRARVESVVRRVQGTEGATALVVEVPSGFELLIEQRTSDAVFRTLSANRSSDLSVKRNLGLMYGHLRGWRKILYIDDDIYDVTADDVNRLAELLETHPVAAMASSEFPDNSVVYHSRRLAGLEPRVFVGGSTLGVNLEHPDTSYFPNIYNEDWFFFARQAAAQRLPDAGEVRQDSYDPYAETERAAREEFGDLIAEGLFSLFEKSRRSGWDEMMRTSRDHEHWVDVKRCRHSMIRATRARLRHMRPSSRRASESEIVRAVQSLNRAERQLALIDPLDCVEFIDAWQTDHAAWRIWVQGCSGDRSERAALLELGLGNWVSCGHDRGQVRGPSATDEPEAYLGSTGMAG